MNTRLNHTTARIGLVAAALFVAGLVVTAGLLPSACAEERKTRLRWILSMEHGPLKTVTVQSPSGKATTYHYMTIEVTNGTGHGRHWYPVVEAHTDTDRVYIAGTCPEALAAIREAEHNHDLVNIASTTGVFANGATKQMVAILEAVDPLYDRLSVRIFGLVDPIAIYRFELYGDQEVIADAVYFDRNQEILKKLKAEAAAAGEELAAPTLEYREVVEQRYWEVVYERLGDEFNAEDDRITFVQEGWRAQGDLKVLRVFGKPSDG